MRSFNKLVINEWLKMSKKRSFFIPYAIVAVVAVVLAWALKRWAGDMVGSAFDYTAMMSSTHGFGQFVAMLAVIFTAGMISSEHGMGTIKFLLIRGQSRGKVLASKYVAALLFALSLIVWLNVISFASGAVLYGTEHASGAWRDIWIAGGSSLVYSIVYMSLTFMMGVLTRSTGAAMGVGMAAIVLSGITIPKSFYKYVLFPNVDLSVYSHGGHPPIDGMTLPFSIAILAVYIVLFLGASFVTFKRRDIA
ncbi:ABC transporter permease subunit [Paenibacillus sp. HJL G12]|uniref:ABC transporter permease subunit n=1 Tax=Paenibacillus dendrobii TaxID=2691084 RepID=A0A7X3IRN1_9BACL|nr:ABC transporter permease [Paenibacillus dendrobii]MWV46982.1 ABC transporter permease subunit [Paenibacillus dendrobii]